MGKQQRQRVRTATLSVHHVQCVTRDLSTLLAERVEPELKRVGVKDTPVLREGLEPVAGHASLPARPEVCGLPIAVQPEGQLAQRIGVQATTILNDSRSPVIVHVTHPDTRHAAHSETPGRGRARPRE